MFPTLFLHYQIMKLQDIDLFLLSSDLFTQFLLCLMVLSILMFLSYQEINYVILAISIWKTKTISSILIIRTNQLMSFQMFPHLPTIQIFIPNNTKLLNTSNPVQEDSHQNIHKMKLQNTFLIYTTCHFISITFKINCYLQFNLYLLKMKKTQTRQSQHLNNIPLEKIPSSLTKNQYSNKNSDRQLSKPKKKPLYPNSDSLGRKSKPPSNQINTLATYFKTLEHSRNQVSKSNQTIESMSQINNLEKEIEKKELERDSLRKQQISIDEEINLMEFEHDKYKKRFNEIMKESLRKMYQNKRKNRIKDKSNIGSVLETKYRNQFIEGPDFIKTRLKKAENDKALHDVLIQLQNPQKQAYERAALQFKLRLLQKQHQKLTQQLTKLEDQKAQFNKLLLLKRQQEQCKFAKAQWPVLNNRYITLELLGKGGFSEVYKCFDLELADYVALKLSFPTQSSTIQCKQTYMKHIEREYATQKQLNHPNIAKLYNLVEMNDRWVLATTLELCSGPELQDYMKKNKYMQEKEAKFIIKQILEALQYMSKHKVIHYDLKPRNILFHEGVIKVLDFGLCKVLDTNQTRMQLTSPGVGTYWYLPPESFQGDSMISSKVDIWSVGVIFYEMLFGKRPFGHGMSQNRIMKEKIILNANVVQFPKDERFNQVSEEAKKFICSCLKHNQDQRISVSEANNCEYMRYL